MKLPEVPPVAAVRVSDDRTLLTVTYEEPISERLVDDGFDILPAPLLNWLIVAVMFGAIITVMAWTMGVALFCSVHGFWQWFGLVETLIATFLVGGVVGGYTRLAKIGDDAIPAD